MSRLCFWLQRWAAWCTLRVLRPKDILVFMINCTTERRGGGRLSTPAYLLLLAAFAVVTMAIGYVWYAPGVLHQNNYHEYSFAALNYSDIIWLYFRDNLAARPRPYIDYALEYPALLGGLTYVLSFVSNLPAYFALTYAILACCALGTIVALDRLPGVSTWQFALAPALLLYTGLNWDLAALFFLALALLAYQRGHDRWGTLALVCGVWFKLFPLVFLAAVVVERFRERRWRAIGEIMIVFVLGSAAINLPLALAHWDNWSYFFTFNAERGGGSGFWVLFPDLAPAQVNQISLVVLGSGALALMLLALRAQHAVLLPLGASLLLWWLFVNKVFSPQYALWIFFSLALLHASRSLWIAVVATDVGHFFVSFLILFSLRFNIGDLIGWQNQYLRTPLELFREALLLVGVAYGVKLLQNERVARRREETVTAPTT